MMEELEHLKQGSEHPPLKKGSMRIYNMRFCPYAQRSLLVAEAKRISYDIINVDLTDKPDWFLKLNPRGLVPTIEYEDGSHLPESLIMCDYLDEKYPERPLYPKDPLLKARERILIERFNEIITQMFKLFFSFGKPDQDTSPYDIILQKLQPYEIEISSRGSEFFGGSSPGMLDYMIWPWIERVGMLSVFGGNKFDLLVDGNFPSLRKWRDLMIKDEAVKKWFLDTKVHAHYLQSRLEGKADYDYLVKKSKY